MAAQSSLSGSKSCAFCRIISKEEPSRIVFEDQETLAFLDLRPLFPGHVLLVPKKHYSTIADVPKEEIGYIFNTVKLLSAAVEKGMDSDGVFIAVNNKVSQSVPHVHVHIVPRKFHDGLKGFFWPRTSYKSDDEMKRVQERIFKAITAGPQK